MDKDELRELCEMLESRVKRGWSLMGRKPDASMFCIFDYKRDTGYVVAWDGGIGVYDEPIDNGTKLAGGMYPSIPAGKRLYEVAFREFFGPRAYRCMTCARSRLRRDSLPTLGV